jgi:hypothetical protein
MELWHKVRTTIYYFTHADSVLYDLIHKNVNLKTQKELEKYMSDSLALNITCK